MATTDLYWIDDAVSEMSMILENVFPLLWDRDYSSSMILFGNHYCSNLREKGLTEKDKDALIGIVEREFMFYCQGKDNEEWRDAGETYNRKKELLVQPLVQLIKLNNGDEETTSGEDNDLIQLWMDKEKLSAITQQAKTAKGDESLEQTQMSVKTLIEKMDIPDKAVIALDLALLYGDDNRLSAGLPIISMALCSALSLNHACYLYSSRSISQQWIENWKRVYMEVYKKAAPRIHPKNGLITKRSDTTAKKELCTIIRNNKEKMDDDKR